jgi:hypothetical protein
MIESFCSPKMPSAPFLLTATPSAALFSFFLALCARRFSSLRTSLRQKDDLDR